MKGTGLGSALVIEDEMLVAWATRDAVERLGFDPVMVATTDHAAALASERQDLSLIVCDLDLGTISANGLDVLERVDPNEKIASVIHTAIDTSLILETIRVRRPNSVILQKLATENDLETACSEAFQKLGKVLST